MLKSLRRVIPLVLLTLLTPSSCSPPSLRSPRAPAPAHDSTPLLSRQSPSPPITFYTGHDLSSLSILESSGAIYYDSQNQSSVSEDILSAGGMNTVRLRLWVNPPAPSDYDLAYVLALAQRFSAKGLRIYLDFHFSDTWADPQHNNAPVAWPGDLDALASTLKGYVNETLVAFAEGGVQLDLVSLGNEIRHGMLWPLGQVDVDVSLDDQERVANFTNLATLYKAAREGVDDAVQSAAAEVTKPQVMIHIDNGWNLTLQEAWFGALTGTGIVSDEDWDVFGFSFYPFYGTAATLANLETSLTTLAQRYGKPIQVVETDYPAICNASVALSEPTIPVSVQGQTEWVRDIVDVVKGLPGGLGQGVHYWEPAWLNLTGLGSACEDAILFDTDWSEWPVARAYARDSVNMFLDV
ncbi:MAG: hypothetical protein Q9160_007964 [Pyrenula sp. 1 TL-2023]